MSAPARSAAGFTLTELMIAVAIVAILAAVAYPSYQDSVRKARRADAKTALLELAGFMERNYSTVFRYDRTGTADDSPAITLPFAQLPREGGMATYTLRFRQGTLARQTFEIEALPANAQTGDPCGTLTINQTGTRGVRNAAAGQTAATCWGQ